jgi:adenine-specific DNA methylase
MAGLSREQKVSQLAMSGLLLSAHNGQELDAGRAFPEEFVNALSRQEVFNKHLFRPNTYLHKWWARRCGSTFRAILKQFADDERRDYYTPGGLEGKVVLDPMMGGGTTLHEAIRLGANVIGADIDPIPIAQARASLTQAPLSDLRSDFNSFFSNLYSSLAPYFRTECPICQKTGEIQYTLYGVGKTCACGSVVQVDVYDLRHEADREIRICPENWKIGGSPATTPRLVTKAEKECPSCAQEYKELLDLPFYARYMPVAIFLFCDEHGYLFRPPGESDLALIELADSHRKNLDFGPTSDLKVKDGPKSGDLLKRNVHSYLDVFSSRQLMYLDHCIRQLRDYTGAGKLNLGMLVSTSLEFNSMLCGYKGWYKRRPGAIRHTFALHAYSFQYTALENNPVNWRKSSGNLQQLFRDRIERGRKWAALPVERMANENGKTSQVKIVGESDSGIEIFNPADIAQGHNRFWLIQGDSRNLPVEDGSVDLVVTDPPYYDNVQYSDLAAFFRVWLSRLLPAEAEWAYDEAASAVAVKGTDYAGSFLTALTGIFAECGRVLKPGAGRLAFTFHHWDPGAWADVTTALKQAGFRLLNAHVVYSEHPISVHIRGLKSIKHDSILVLSHDDGSETGRWTPVDAIDTDDSESFCRQCGAAVGWLLEGGMSPDEIRAVWKNLIRGRTR